MPCASIDLAKCCPLGYNSRGHCLLLQYLHTTSTILAGAQFYFVVSSFKCEGKNSCHDLIPNPAIYGPFISILKHTVVLVHWIKIRYRVEMQCKNWDHVAFCKTIREVIESKVMCWLCARPQLHLSFWEICATISIIYRTKDSVENHKHICAHAP